MRRSPLIGQNGERFWEVELHRIKGELLQQNGTEEEAESCFQTALNLAQQRSEKSLELRVAMSLSKLYQSQNRGEEVKPVLVQIYQWFTEGFNTVDLQAARKLIGKLE